MMGKWASHGLASDPKNESLGVCGIWAKTNLEPRFSGKISENHRKFLELGDGLDDSDLDSEEDEDAQDDLEDQNAAIIGLSTR